MNLKKKEGYELTNDQILDRISKIIEKKGRSYHLCKTFFKNKEKKYAMVDSMMGATSVLKSKEISLFLKPYYGSTIRECLINTYNSIK